MKPEINIWCRPSLSAWNRLCKKLKMNAAPPVLPVVKRTPKKVFLGDISYAFSLSDVEVVG